MKWPRRPRETRWLAIAAGLALTAGCTSGTGAVRNHPDAIDLPTAAPTESWTTSVLIANNARSGRTITVDIDGRRAIDASFPAAPPGANNPTVSEYRYDLGPGVHRLVAADSEERAPVTVTIRGTKQIWVVVQDYDGGIPLEATAYDKRPGFG